MILLLERRAPKVDQADIGAAQDPFDAGCARALEWVEWWVGIV